MSIIRRLDTDGDTKISMNEFIKGLEPSQPYSKLMTRQKMSEQPGNLYKDKKMKQGVNYLHFQDAVLNLRNGSRGKIRCDAFDKNQQKNKSTYGLKIRPDMFRVNSGLFKPDLINDSARKVPFS